MAPAPTLVPAPRKYPSLGPDYRYGQNVPMAVTTIPEKCSGSKYALTKKFPLRHQLCIAAGRKLTHLQNIQNHKQLSVSVPFLIPGTAATNTKITTGSPRDKRYHPPTHLSPEPQPAPHASNPVTEPETSPSHLQHPTTKPETET